MGLFVRSQDNQETLPDLAVEVRGLTKIYGGARGEKKKPALDDLSLSIPRGSIFGLLGPNGAGKSTLINILAGLVQKTSGSARVWDFDTELDTRRARSAIGVVPQELNLDAFFTPYELLEQQAGFYGVPKKERTTNEILSRLNLTAQTKAFAYAMSGGMKRRLMVAKAMVHRPPLLVLDEPTAGVDVALRRELWDEVRRLNDAGTTILLTTHYLEEAESLCTHIAIMKQGRIVANDTKENLLKQLDSKEILVSLARPLGEIPGVIAAAGWRKVDEATLALSYQPSRVDLGQQLLSLQAYGLAIRDVTTQEADIETLFLRLTGA